MFLPWIYLFLNTTIETVVVWNRLLHSLRLPIDYRALTSVTNICSLRIRVIPAVNHTEAHRDSDHLQETPRCLLKTGGLLFKTWLLPREMDLWDLEFNIMGSPTYNCQSSYISINRQRTFVSSMDNETAWQ